ncbi:hypothetical protein B0H15DRAFT_856436 [Mycena belliarum]|uniref:Uncharacterized protein n=1 Tax=Mycena belliarum TaxID=1033014 RepID=A0AAD6TQW9_9AGAR|nr:hypothetical protein B0H15DRAFT_868355 [Mycena belliae]KAJ7080574.1 hypothetical protein B0H15DRAFT_856436 [Mycena belliae]
MSAFGSSVLSSASGCCTFGPLYPRLCLWLVAAGYAAILDRQDLRVLHVFGVSPYVSGAQSSSLVDAALLASCTARLLCPLTAHLPGVATSLEHCFAAVTHRYKHEDLQLLPCLILDISTTTWALQMAQGFAFLDPPTVYHLSDPVLSFGLPFSLASNTLTANALQLIVSEVGNTSLVGNGRTPSSSLFRLNWSRTLVGGL